MKRIAIIADPMDNQRAGVHVYTKQMVKSLLENDSDNFYLIFREKSDTSLSALPNCRLLVIPNFIGFTAIRKFFIIPLLAIYFKADAVIEPAHFGPFFLPKRVRRVTVIHDLSAVLFPQWHSFYSSMLQRLFLKRILRQADLIISNSFFTEREITKYYPFAANKVKTIYPGVLKANEQQSEQITAEDFPFFLYVGTLEPRKNLGLLLDAFKQYKDQSTSNMQLYIVGAKGWKIQDFFDSYHAHPYKSEIHILGFVRAELLTHYYQNCEAFVYPSFYEGFGFPVIEAMQHGATCITTQDSSMSEISYPYAIYFKNNDVLSLVAALQSVANFKNVNSKDEIMQQASKYNWSNFAKKMTLELKKLCQ